MPKVNPEILVWARETAGLSIEEAAEKLSIKEAYGKSPTERLIELENGKAEPTRTLLNDMSKKYHRPLIVFYLAEPPVKGDRGQDFRRFPSEKFPEEEAVLDALIRDVLVRQSILRSALIDELEENEVKLDFIGSMSVKDGVEKVLKSIKKHIEFDLEEFRKKRNPREAFRYLRQKVEDAGIYVLLLGNLGSYHTNLDVEIFRGFALSDPYAPFIIINDQDSPSAWSFTLLHELTHLFLGQTGISDANPYTPIEKFCNDVASECLLSPGELVTFKGADDLKVEEIAKNISKFAGERNVSNSLVAYRIYRAGYIKQRQWKSLHNTFRNQWLNIKENKRNKSKKTEGGPSYYTVRKNRLGSAILEITKQFMNAGALTTTKASMILGVKPKNVQRLLKGVA